MKIEVYTINAFAKNINGGNPAGIVFNWGNYNKNIGKALAKKLKISEVAFIDASNKASYKLSFFTPKSEVDLCGHATIGAFYLLFSLGKIKQGNYLVETKAGILNINVGNNGLIFMDQKKPEFFEKICPQKIVDSLGINENDLIPNLPIQIVSTGLRDILIPIQKLDVLLKMKPNFNKIKKISEKYKVIGYHAFCLETKFGSTAHCRNFAPNEGIDEESATETSNGALSCYLFNYKIISGKQATKLVYEQGYSMEKPSEIFAWLGTSQGEIIKVRIGGSAKNIVRKEINI